MKILNAFLNGYFKQKTAETGRSMVEILGVLAVIGVLSIGGIYGYTFAMDKYRANDIIYEVNLRGQDIWHKYQEKQLPETIDEWADTTQTGYPIGIETAPDDNLFQINVDNVSPRVCKFVLTGQYKSVYAMVVDGENGTIFNGDVGICGSDDSANKTMLFSFDILGDFDSGHGLCITDTDCGEGCFYCGTNHLCQTTCSGSKSVCSSSKKACVECETSDQCPTGKVCNDIDNTCEKVDIEACEAGYFRSKNGICVECSYAGNIIIDRDEKFGKDEVTGLQSCQACAESQQQRIIESNTENTYCSKTCTMGISYQSKSDGCISCQEEVAYAINENDKESVDQCNACGNYIWKDITTWACSKVFNCEEGTFMGKDWSGGTLKTCASCSVNIRHFLPSRNPALLEEAAKICNNCPTTAPRRVEDGRCLPRCIQPDEDESISVCQANPEDVNCKRQWQDKIKSDAMLSFGVCRPCSSTESGYVGTDETSIYYQMCINCGRKVNSDGYCYLDKNCDVGQFKGLDGACYGCDDTKPVEIESDEKSGCTTNCMKDSNGKFGTGGAIKGRYSDDKYCYKDCGEGNFNGRYGCLSCNTVGDYYNAHSLINPNSDKLRQSCTSCPSPYERQVVSGGNVPIIGSAPNGLIYCALKNCQNGFHVSRGMCVSCSASGCGGLGCESAIESECEACKNRVMINGKCVLFKPQTSAVCNNIGNTIPTYLYSDLKDDATSYIATYEQNIKNQNFEDKMFRDQDGICYRCDITKEISVGDNEAGKEQCKHCGNRRFSKGQCLYGLCSEANTFLRADTGECIGCGMGGKKVEILTSAASQNLCSSCTGYRTITTGNVTLGNLKAYCIESCTDLEFADIYANCYNENATQDNIEIGSDEKSIADCNKMNNRTAVVNEETGQVVCRLL